MRIHTESKTLYHPSQVDEAILRAAFHMRRQAFTNAVYLGNRVVGLVRGNVQNDDVQVLRIPHKMWLGFNTYDAVDNAIRQGSFIQPYFHKDSSGYNRTNVWGDYWPISGVPGAGDYSGTANTARQFDNTTPGALELRSKTPSSGTRHLVAKSMVSTSTGSNTPQLLWLYDRVLSYDGCSITTSTTTLTNTLTAQRYAGSGEEGLKICITASAALGAVASNLSSMTVTDHTGTTGVSIAAGYTLPWYTSAGAPATNALASVAVPHDTINTGTIAPFIPTPSGLGVRKVEAFSSSAINTGTVCIALIKPLALIWQPGSQIMSMLETPRMTFQMPRIFDTACLSFLAISSHGNGSFTLNNQGWLRIAHG